MIIEDHLSLTCGESQHELLHTPFEPEVIYLDPMFPQKEKSALVKKRHAGVTKNSGAG